MERGGVGKPIGAGAVAFYCEADELSPICREGVSFLSKEKRERHSLLSVEEETLSSLSRRERHDLLSTREGADLLSIEKRATLSSL